MVPKSFCLALYLIGVSSSTVLAFVGEKLQHLPAGCSCTILLGPEFDLIFALSDVLTQPVVLTSPRVLGEARIVDATMHDPAAGSRGAYVCSWTIVAARKWDREVQQYSR